MITPGRAVHTVIVTNFSVRSIIILTLDMEAAIQHGRKEFEPGILAAANRNILYIDEINLLEDHIVDILLDSAAMGVKCRRFFVILPFEKSNYSSYTKKNILWKRELMFSRGKEPNS